MINVTRLNGHALVVNAELIRTVEENPDTVITLVNGDVESTLSQAVFALWGVSGSVVLASFGVSVAGKYLTVKNESTR